MSGKMMRNPLLGVLACLLLLGCGTREKKPQPPPLDSLLAGLTEQEGRACIKPNDIRGFGILRDQVVSVSGRRGEHYLVTTRHFCNSLDSSYEIAFVGSFSDVCGGGAGSQILTRDESCPIKHIYEFKSREEAFATLELARKKQEALALPPFKAK